MNPSPRSHLVIALQILFGVFILFLGYRTVNFKPRDFSYEIFQAARNLYLVYITLDV